MKTAVIFDQKKFALLRIIILSIVTLLYPLCGYFEKTHAIFCVGILVATWAYSLGVYSFVTKPRPQFLSASLVLSTVDFTVALLWIKATGSFYSPFYIVLYPMIIAVSLLYSIQITAAAVALCLVGYFTILLTDAQIDQVEPSELIIRMLFLMVSGFMGVIVSQQASERTRTQVKQQEKQILIQELDKVTQSYHSLLLTASHDFKIPIHSLLLKAQMILKKVETQSPLRKDLDLICRQVKKLTFLIDQLMDVSKIVSGKSRYHFEEFDFNEFMKEIVEVHLLDFENAGCTVQYNDGGPLLVRTDRSQMEHVVMNVFSNSIKFGAGKPIEISAKSCTNIAMLEIKDHGMGIAPENQKCIFEKFEQLSTQYHRSGLGLGLWIAREIMDSLGGKIRVKSELGQGAAFTIELPVVTEGVLAKSA